VIDIDYFADSVVIEYDPLLINKDEIKKRLEKSDYKFVRVAH
jgi:copper chaperone